MSKDFFHQVNWEVIGKRLLRFCVYKGRWRSWPEGKLWSGYDHIDVVNEAIMKFTSRFNGEEYDTEEKIEKKLQNIITNRLKDLSERKENNPEDLDITNDIYTTEFDDSCSLDGLLDKEKFVAEVLDVIDDDLQALIILERVIDDKERQEICADNGITTREYDNAIRSLRRKVEPIINSYGIWRIKN